MILGTWFFFWICLLFFMFPSNSDMFGTKKRGKGVPFLICIWFNILICLFVVTRMRCIQRSWVHESSFEKDSMWNPKSQHTDVIMVNLRLLPLPCFLEQLCSCSILVFHLLHWECIWLDFLSPHVLLGISLSSVSLTPKVLGLDLEQPASPFPPTAQAEVRCLFVRVPLLLRPSWRRLWRGCIRDCASEKPRRWFQFRQMQKTSAEVTFTPSSCL